jgi:hypothetical protein
MQCGICCYHSMAHLQVAEGTASDTMGSCSITNKQLQTVDKVWPSSLGAKRNDTNSSQVLVNTLLNLHIHKSWEIY